MTNEVISPLRRRMIEDMTVRKLSPKTQQGYIRTIKNFAAFLGRSPDKASFEDVGTTLNCTAKDTTPQRRYGLLERGQRGIPARYSSANVSYGS